MKTREMSAVSMARATTLGFLVSLCLLAMPGDALACRQNPTWCMCIEGCQDGYWLCRNQGGSSAACLAELNICQLTCDEHSPQVFPGGGIDPVLDSAVAPEPAGGLSPDRVWARSNERATASFEKPEILAVRLKGVR